MTARALTLGLALLGAAGCSALDSTAPPTRLAPTDASFNSSWSSGQNKGLTCNFTAPVTASAEFGPSGGTLFFGFNALVIPPGALDKKVTISATIPAGTQFKVDFQPHGLQFKKPAGLILDASRCGNVPNVVYLDEEGNVLQRITAIFSTWWHLIAAPLDHFSIYAIDV